MKKIIFATLFCLLGIGVACADMPTDKDYENLDELRVKIVRMKREMDKFMKDILSRLPLSAPQPSPFAGTGRGFRAGRRSGRCAGWYRATGIG